MEHGRLERPPLDARADPRGADRLWGRADREALDASLPDSAVPLGLLAAEAAVPREPMLPMPVERPAVTGLKWLCCMDCCRCAVCCWNDCGCEALCVPKKCRELLLRMVEGAAARPLADKLAREGTTGKLPVIMCALLNCS